MCTTCKAVRRLVEVAGCRLDLDLKTGTTGAEQGRPAPEVSTKQPLPKKNHPTTTTTTTTTPSLLLLSTTKVILSFPDVCSCEFFSLHLYLIVSLDRLSFVCLWVSLLLYLYFAHLTSQIGMSRCLNQFFIVRCVVT